ncbi:MAG TPA: DNA polymerase III subunit alpha [Planctomycetota bacterium]|jgi:DNA-directed DNA polymerase III PolC|nr:DNA polymerase III subunit alpha [Planctomycetota bacterium]
MVVPLRVHSAFTFLTGASSIEALLARAAELGLSALALTDANGLYGAIPFLFHARRAGIRPIFGAEIDEPEPSEGSPRRPDDGRAVCLVRDASGWTSLCRLITARHLAPDFDLARAIGENAAGLLVLADTPSLLARLRERVPAGSLFAALDLVRRPSARGSRARAPEEPAEPLALKKAPDPAARRDPAGLLDAARRLGIPVAASPEVWFAREEDFPVHRTLVAIKWNAVAAALPGAHLAGAEAFLRPAAELEALYGDLPDALENARAIAETCRFEPEIGKVFFPTVPLPPGETPYSSLCALAMEGARRRYRPLKPAVLRRLEYELEAIERLGFSAYFLLVRTIAQFAKEKEIPCVGRGSAACSLVSFVLGLTDADPLRYDLPFERFLNPARADRPDIDLDFCWRRRDEAIEFVYRTYGEGRVATIATVNTFGLRAAFREAARAAGLPPHEVDRWSKALPHADREGVRAAIARTPECRGFPADVEPYRSVLAVGERLEGLPRHLGLHPGGVVVAPGPLPDLLPLERASKGVVVAQFDKDGVEALGLVKMDLLGNRGLSTVTDCAARLRARRVAIDLEAIPEDDPSTAHLLREGRTIGCFQIESPGMRNLLRQLDATTMDRAIQAVALIRPGPAASGMKERFVRRALGLEPVEVPDPRLASVLADTFGVMLYQEDILRVAQAIAGMDFPEGDRLRSALTKRFSPERLEKIRARFLAGAAARGVPGENAQAVWKWIGNFAAFSFCKAHAVTYGRIAYRAAYLKAHHPADFLASFLQNDTGYYDARVYVEEARRLGVRILPPDIHRSEATFASEDPTEDASKGSLRVGLGQVRGLAQATIERILEERAKAPFLSLRDFVARVPASRPEVENLILVGSFDAFERSRPELLWRAALLLGTGLKPFSPARGSGGVPLGEAMAAAKSRRWSRRGAALFPKGPPPEPAVPSLPEYDPRKRGLLELELLGLTIEEHPLDLFDGGELPRRVVPLRELPAHAGRVVTVVGWLATSRATHTEGGERMRFLTLEDKTGLAEAVLFPEPYRKFGHRLRGPGPYEVRGKVENQNGAFTLTASWLAPTDAG